MTNKELLKATRAACYSNEKRCLPLSDRRRRNFSEKAKRKQQSIFSISLTDIAWNEMLFVCNGKIVPTAQGWNARFVRRLICVKRKCDFHDVREVEILHLINNDDLQCNQTRFFISLPPADGKISFVHAKCFPSLVIFYLKISVHVVTGCSTGAIF